MAGSGLARFCSRLTICLLIGFVQAVLYARATAKKCLMRRRLNHGDLSEHIDRKVPAIPYKKLRSRGSSSSSSECAVCLSGLEEWEEVRKLKCRHAFHKGCLDTWLMQEKESLTCPLCRMEILSRDVVSRYRLGKQQQHIMIDDENHNEEEEMLILSALQQYTRSI